MTDEALLDRIADGEQAALRLLYERWSSILMGIALKFIKSRAEAEDVTHDVLLEIWHTATQYDPGRGTARTWIVMKMRSRVIDRIRKRQRRATLLHDGADLVRPQTPTPGPVEAYEHKQLRERVASMQPSQREVLQLTYFEHMTSSEVAARLDLPVGTVKSRLAAARRALRDSLEEGTS